jgi:hypothetical protein
MKSSLGRLRSLLRLALPTALALLLAGCPGSTSVTVDANATTMTGSDKVSTENRPLGAFSKLDVAGAASVDLEIGTATSLAITTDDNLLPLIETKVDGGTLHIRPTQNYHSNLGVKVTITTPTLEGIDLSGAVDLQARGLDTPTLALNISGVGHANLAGKTNSFAAQLSGAAAIDTDNLAAQNVKIDISGTGAAKVCATASLDATISGAGSVHYSGHPAQVKKSVSGVGSIQEE